MDFGVLVFPQPDRCVDHARLAEAKGFSHVWVEDSPMMAGDVYLCLGLMARHTSRVTLGPAWQWSERAARPWLPTPSLRSISLLPDVLSLG